MNHERFPSLITWCAKKQKFLAIDGEWVVTEKIHGANMCVMTNGVEVEVCSRNQKLKPAEYEKFHRCTELVASLQQPMLEMFRSMKTANTLRVYGEIYGGFYPSESKQAPKSQKPVQQEIMYCKPIKFRAFKIKVDGKWLSKTETKNICKTFQIEIAPELFRGTAEQCMEYSHKHLTERTTIPTMDGSPLLEWMPNIREGHVIEPDVQEGDPIMIKHKNKEFEEYKMGSIPEAKPQKPSRGDFSDILEEASKMMTKQRLQNVMSHDVPYPDFRKYLGPMTLDILKECLLSHELNEKDQNQLRKLISQRIVFPALEKLFNELHEEE